MEVAFDLIVQYNQRLLVCSNANYATNTNEVKALGPGNALSYLPVV